MDVVTENFTFFYKSRAQNTLTHRDRIKWLKYLAPLNSCFCIFSCWQFLFVWRWCLWGVEERSWQCSRIQGSEIRALPGELLRGLTAEELTVFSSRVLCRALNYSEAGKAFWVMCLEEQCEKQRKIFKKWIYFVFDLKFLEKKENFSREKQLCERSSIV